MSASAIAQARALAEQAIVWQGRKGANCPLCGRRMRVGSTQEPVRFCYCKNKTCLICLLAVGVKALPEDAS